MYVPRVRACKHSVTADVTISYIFGGYCEAMKPGEFNKLYRFDIRTPTTIHTQKLLLTLVCSRSHENVERGAGEGPGARGPLALLYGGGTGLFVCIWRLESHALLRRPLSVRDRYAYAQMCGANLGAASSTWSRIKLRDEHGLIQGGIQHHSCIVYHNFLLIYGGTVNGRLNEQLFVMPI